MKGDFSRLTFNPGSGYVAVLKQQGRADLDSDWNEQAEIWKEQLRQLTADILGAFAIPLVPNRVTHDNSQALKVSDFVTGPGGVFDFAIGKGLAYIGGLPFWLQKDATFRSQPDYPEPDIPPGEGNLLVYVEVWEKVASYIDDPFIREPALAGADTCLRVKVVGQVKAITAGDIEQPDEARELLDRSFPPPGIRLTFQVEHPAHQLSFGFGEADVGGAMIPGNLHYRLELHRGTTGDGSLSEGFKWSDDNAAVLVRILKKIDSCTFLVEEPEQVAGESLKTGDWLEVSNAVTELHLEGSQMVRIKTTEVTSEGLLVSLDSPIHPFLLRFKKGGRGATKMNLAPRLRRWSGYVSPLVFKTKYDLGRGIKVVFSSASEKATFSPSDYWTFSLRDREYNKLFAPREAFPAGIRKYRHPLAIILRKGKKPTGKVVDCRLFFRPMAGPAA